MTNRQRKKYKQALAGFDEINTFWVDKMDIPEAEKRLRVEMMNYLRDKITEMPKTEPAKKVDYMLFAAVGYVAYKLLYEEFVKRFYLRYVQTVGAQGQAISDFAEYWISNHAAEFAGYAHTDAQATARTETNALCSLAQLDAYFQMGFTKKQWVTMGDNKVRQTHRAAAGQIRLLEEPFIVGDSMMMFPQDSSLGASAAEIVNCRCSMRPIK